MTAAQRRRGLSPIVSVILLILVAVGATIILYTWLSSAASNNPTHSGELYERVVINAVQYNSTAGKATIYVTNLGKVGVNITSAYILDAVNGQAVCSNTSANVKINAGETGNVTITQCHLGKGVYIAKVVTSDGVSATYTFTR